MAAWAMSTPIGSGPDEPTSLIHTAAIVRGQLVGAAANPDLQNHTVYTVVHVPATFGVINHGCYQYRPTMSAQCAAPAVTSNRRTVTVLTLVGHYPPLYYLVAGLPSFLPGGIKAVVAMRLAGAAVAAAFLATALYAVRYWARNRIMLIGLAFAISPMVLYIGSVLNPSAWEVSGSVCLWTLAAVWLVERASRPPRALIWASCLSTCVLIQTRPASLAWPFVISAVLAFFLLGRNFRGAVGTLWTGVRIATQKWERMVMGALLTLSAVFTVVWLFAVNPFLQVGVNFPAPGTPYSKLLSRSIGYMPMYLNQAVGNFSWLDTPLPSSVTHFWYLSVAVLLLAALIVGSWADRLAVMAMMVVSFAIPVLGTLADVHRRGFSSQGRYFLPVFVGLPIVAAAALGRNQKPGLPTRAAHGQATRADPLARAGLGGVLALVAAAQVIAMGSALRRFMVGTNGPLLPTATGRGSWHPPIPGTALDVIVLLAAAGIYGWLALRPAPPAHIARS
jgi:hypothetical protein